MEPSTKKRKLAPKVSANGDPRHQTAHFALEAQQTPQAYPVSEPPVSERHDFESFARHLQDAAMLIQQQSERPGHSEVSVLLLKWEDDTAVSSDLNALKELLENRFRYQTRQWHIPSAKNSSIKLGVQLASFIENANPNQLLVIYYAGYGYIGNDKELYWACDASEDAAKLKWDGIRRMFEDTPSDILLLLDTCSVPEMSVGATRGIKQVIAASSADYSPWKNRYRRSFTSNMTDALDKLLTDGRSFSTQRLFDELNTLYLKQPVPTPGTNGNNTSQQLPQPHLFFTLSPGKTSKNLVIAPPRRTTPTISHLLNGKESRTHGSNSSETQVGEVDTMVDLRFDEPRILVCTTFVGEASPDMSSFHQWLHDAPALASIVSVEGMFLGPPTMLLISMPHSVWNIVQHDKVCCFLGYISSHNMLHLYQKLVQSTDVRQSPNGRSPAAGHHWPEVRDAMDGSSIHSSHEKDGYDPVRAHHPQTNGTFSDRLHNTPLSTPSSRLYPPGPVRSHGKPKNDMEDSAEMQEAAEQLKALSHVRHLSDESPSSVDRHRTHLPNGTPCPTPEASTHSHVKEGGDGFEKSISTGFPSSPSARNRGTKRSLPKQETRCDHCSHAPFKDSSSLRKHIAAAHTRPFPCAFSFAGCMSTFGSKNEWKRHIASQHLCLQYYRCSACPNSAAEGKGNEFNRKDLFTQHLRRMHAPFQVKRPGGKGDGKVQADWEQRVRDMQQSCLVTRRHPPQHSACPKSECQSIFEGPGAWDEWTEHVGRHMEKGEGARLGVDRLLAKWALDEGIIDETTPNQYRLSPGHNQWTTGNGHTNGISLHAQESSTISTANSTLTDEGARTEEQPPGREGEIDG